MRVVIKEIREKSGITLEELADEIGVEMSVISRLEENKLDKCNSQILTRIADVLGVQVSEIFLE